MSLLKKIKRFVSDPPPEVAFEVSAAGIAWAPTEPPATQRFHAFSDGVVEVSPLHDNITGPEEFSSAVGHLLPPSPAKRRRLAALILPDYCARVAVIDFDTFPTDPAEQLALARFRVKRVVPFDIESAVVACHAQPRANEKKVDVTVAVVNREVAAHYERPFVAAGYHCGFITISALASLSLTSDVEAAGAADMSPSVTAKLSGRVLAVSLVQGPSLRMFRCIELDQGTEEEIFDVLGPTFAFAEDELKTPPKLLRVSGFPHFDEAVRMRWEAEIQLPVAVVQSRLGAVTSSNAGLLGYLESVEDG